MGHVDAVVDPEAQVQAIEGPECSVRIADHVVGTVPHLARNLGGAEADGVGQVRVVCEVLADMNDGRDPETMCGLKWLGEHDGVHVNDPDLQLAHQLGELRNHLFVGGASVPPPAVVEHRQGRNVVQGCLEVLRVVVGKHGVDLVSRRVEDLDDVEQASFSAEDWTLARVPDREDRRVSGPRRRRRPSAADTPDGGSRVGPNAAGM